MKNVFELFDQKSKGILSLDDLLEANKKYGFIINLDMKISPDDIKNVLAFISEKRECTSLTFNQLSKAFKELT